MPSKLQMGVVICRDIARANRSAFGAYNGTSSIKATWPNVEGTCHVGRSAPDLTLFPVGDRGLFEAGSGVIPLGRLCSVVVGLAKMIDVAPPLRPIPDISIQEFVASNPYVVEPDTVVYIEYGTGRQITFQSYLDFARHLASGLRHPAAFKKPLKYGDRVQIISPNFVCACDGPYDR
jgi:hypothetical protein